MTFTHDDLLRSVNAGWNPTVALPAGSKHVTDVRLSPCAPRPNSVASAQFCSVELSQDWPLASLDAALTIDAAYLLFVLVGSIVMYFLPAVPERVLYPLKFVYNLTQMFLCGYMSIESLMLKNRNNYTLFPVEKHNPFNAVAPPLANLLWLFYISKALDFVDTFTIVLQKRWNQLSFLHVYHHSSIFLFYWLLLRRGYDGDIFLTITLNGAIHAIMYTYYFVSMHTKDIWWKKYLTQMQMVQFCTMIAQGGLLLRSGDSAFPPRMTQAYIVYIFSMLVLFMQFYLSSYAGKKKRDEKPDDKKTK